MRLLPFQVSIALAAIACCPPAAVRSQTPMPGTADTSRSFNPDDLTVSLGGGLLVPAHHLVDVPPDAPLPGPPFSPRALVRFYRRVPTFTASVRAPLGDSFLLEGEVSRASASGDSGLEFQHYGLLGQASQFVAVSTVTATEARSAITVGASLLYRVGTPRVSTFFGGGPAIRATTGNLDVRITCQTLQPGGCEERPNGQEIHQGGTTVRPALQLIAGFDLALATRVAAFTAVRWTGAGPAPYDRDDADGFGMTAGMRVAVLALAKPQTLATASPPGRYVAQGTLIGLVVGGLVGVVHAASFSDEGRLVVPMFDMGIGAGAGAVVGAIVKSARRAVAGFP